MNPDRWAIVRHIFHEVCDLPASARDAALRRLCQDDGLLREQVVSLLEADARSADFLGPPALVVAPDALAELGVTSLTGRVGPYRIVREIGQGGMGTVYLAERDDDEYRQQVAIKIATQAQSPSALKWLRHERQVLANLQHPNIAKLLDGGTTAQGVPYLVMEYVEGLRVDEYCTENHLDVEERLALFRQICDAVDYAHRNLVVHRDLKPSNILVVDGQPKLLDFGIAKLVGGPDMGNAARPAALPTLPGMMTPEYASPEQIRGERITTATDVFALGVLLYRLLTGDSPYRLESTAPHELAKAICDQEPVRPSSVVSDRRVRRALRGGLDTIVLKALKKDPSERYLSVAQFADDIRRHVERLPLVAHADSLAYRASRFVFRHKATVAAAALVFLALVIGLGATLWQAERAESERLRAQRHFDEVRQLASALIFDVHDGIENLPGSVPIRQELVRRALGYFDRLAVEETYNADLQRELASAYEKLGSVLGQPFSSNLGESMAALESYQKALTIRERVAALTPGNRRLDFELWSSYFNVAELLRETGQTGRAMRMNRLAVEKAEEHLRTAPNDSEAIRAGARSAVGLSTTLTHAGRLDEALVAARRALELDERLLKLNPSNGAAANDVAVDLGRIGVALLKQGQTSEALPYFCRRLAMAERLAAAEPANVTYKRTLSSTYVQFAEGLVRNGDSGGARRQQSEALRLRQSLAEQNPQDRQAKIDVMFIYREIGDVLLATREYAAAAENYRLAVSLAEPLAAEDPDNAFYKLILASALSRWAVTSVKRMDEKDGAALAQRAIEIAGKASAADPEDARFVCELALAYEALGDAKVRPDPGSARTLYERSLALLKGLRDEGRLAGGTLLGAEPQKLAEIQRKLSVLVDHLPE